MPPRFPSAWSLAFLTCLLGGCGDPIGHADSTPAAIPAATVQTLMQADRQFCDDVNHAPPSERGMTWASWFAPAGRQIVPAQVVQGRPDITSLMAPGLADSGYSLTWTPDMGGVGSGGDMGWTSGRYTSTNRNPEGEQARYGRYVTLWERQTDGTWKAILDTGLPDTSD